MSMASRIVLLFLASLLCFLPPTISQDYLSVVYHNCLHNATTNISSAYLRNLGWALRKLVQLSSSGTVYNITSVGSGMDKTYALFQCRGDQSLQGCYDCVYNVTRTLPDLCPSSIGARIQEDGCYLRYDNKTFFTPDFDYVVGLWSVKTTNDSVALSTIESLIENVTTLAPENHGYAADSAGGIYALAQCLGYLNESECSDCLNSYSWRLTCDSALGEQYHSASCYYRYESYAFYTPAAPSPSRMPTSPRPFSTSPASSTPGSSTHKIEGWKLVVLIVGAVVGVLFDRG